MPINIEVPDELSAALKTDDEQSLKLLSKFLKPALEATVKNLIPYMIEQTRSTHGYSEEVTGLVALLAAKSNDSKDEVLRKALTLYSLALDALEKGNRLAIIDSHDMILHDVIGFEFQSTLVGGVSNRG